MKLTKTILREMINNALETILTEGVTHLSKDSLDDQIDAFLLGFETDSTVDKKLNNESQQGSLKSYLLEKPEEEDVEEEEEEVTVGSEDMDVDVEVEPEKPKLDIDKFTKKVARFIMNYESLLDPMTVIVNRAINYLKEGYDQATSEEFEEILSAEFGIELDADDDAVLAPAAAAAGPIGGSGGA